MTIQEIAARLVECCRKGDFDTAQKELFSTDAISIEPYATPAFEKETKGLPAIIEKGKVFENMTEEMHAIYVTEPVIADNSFAVVMTMDMTMKEKGRMKVSELCVYEVKDGLIVAERFFE